MRSSIGTWEHRGKRRSRQGQIKFRLWQLDFKIVDNSKLATGYQKFHGAVYVEWECDYLYKKHRKICFFRVSTEIDENGNFSMKKLMNKFKLSVKIEFDPKFKIAYEKIAPRIPKRDGMISFTAVEMPHVRISRSSGEIKR